MIVADFKLYCGIEIALGLMADRNIAGNPL